MKQKTIELAQALIRRPSISPNDEGCQQLIAERLEKLGFEIEWMPFNDTLNLSAKASRFARSLIRPYFAEKLS